MEKDSTNTSTRPEEDVKIIHVKVVGGGQADIYRIGEALKTFKEKLPFKLEFIITNDHVELQDVGTLLKGLYSLKKQIDQDKRLEK